MKQKATLEVKKELAEYAKSRDDILVLDFGYEGERTLIRYPLGYENH